MSKEIERKFLVKGDGWRAMSKDAGLVIRQGYLSSKPACTVRVRAHGDRAFITVKGAPTGIVRAEYEYEIPLGDAREMLETLCERPLIEKMRHELKAATGSWVVDVFGGDNEGLVVAEVELDEEEQAIELPCWIAEEVTNDPRYLNVNLVKHPFSLW
jgi:CYTH domain-containing protein